MLFYQKYFKHQVVLNKELKPSWGPWLSVLPLQLKFGVDYVNHANDV